MLAGALALECALPVEGRIGFRRCSEVGIETVFCLTSWQDALWSFIDLELVAVSTAPQPWLKLFCLAHHSLLALWTLASALALATLETIFHNWIPPK